MQPLPASQPETTELRIAKLAVRRSAQVLIDHFHRADLQVEQKQDGSVVSEADTTSACIIHHVLTTHFPHDAVLTEEHPDDAKRLQSKRVWIVDPLDGTSQFLRGIDEFDIFLALVQDGEPIMGVSCHPPSGQLLWAIKGQGTWIEEEGCTRSVGLAFGGVCVATTQHPSVEETLAVLSRATRSLPAHRPIVLPGGFRARQFLAGAQMRPCFTIFVGPGQGLGDGRSYSGFEWDLAATDLIIREAGGVVTDLFGHRLRYNKPDLRNLSGVIASTNLATHTRLLATLEHERGLAT